MMKLIILIAGLFLCDIFCKAHQLSAQVSEFAPIGATWWYSQDEKFPPYNNSFWKIEAKKDTTIEGFSLRIMQRSFITATSGWIDTFYIYQDSGVISLYSPEFMIMVPYFNSNAEVGDTIQTGDGFSFDGMAFSVIDSIVTVNIAGENLKRFYLKDVGVFLSCYFFAGNAGGFDYFTERIGNSKFFFPQFCAADPPSGGPLRCYEDDVLGLYGAIAIDDCEFISSVETSKENAITIYPNPVISQLTLMVVELSHPEFYLVNVSGEQMKIQPSSSFTNQFIFNLQQYPSGIYIINIFNDGDLIGSKSFVKR